MNTFCSTLNPPRLLQSSAYCNRRDSASRISLYFSPVSSFHDALSPLVPAFYSSLFQFHGAGGGAAVGILGLGILGLGILGLGILGLGILGLGILGLGILGLGILGLGILGLGILGLGILGLGILFLGILGLGILGLRIGLRMGLRIGLGVGLRIGIGMRVGGNNRDSVTDSSNCPECPERSKSIYVRDLDEDEREDCGYCFSISFNLFSKPISGVGSGAPILLVFFYLYLVLWLYLNFSGILLLDV